MRSAPLASYDFALVGAPDQCPPDVRDRAVWIELDDDALGRKLDAGRAYAELAGEVEGALAKFGTKPFRTECLRPVWSAEAFTGDRNEKPYYERYGEERVAAGVYKDVLRLREHVLPVADALWSYGERA
jgi:hypothetical protein